MWRDDACVCTIEGHDAHVIAVAVLPGGKRFVSVSTDCTVKLWTLDGALERTLNLGSVVLSAAAIDAERFVVGGWQEAGMYNVDGTLIHTFEGHTSSVNALAATPDGQHVASGGYDTIVNVWDVEGGSLVSKCEGPAGLVRAVAFMADSKRVLSGSDGGAVRVWLLDGTHLNTFEGPPRADGARPSWRCPTMCTPSPAATTSSSSTSTTAACCAPSSTTRTRCPR